MGGYNLRFFKNIPVLFLSIIILLIAVIIFSLNLVRVSLEKDFTEVETTGLKDEVKVYENFNGIPHILAKSEADMFFAIGYYHAKDRLWQMDVMKRTAEGRLSEIFGDTTLREDLFLRSLELSQIARKSLKKLSSKSLEILKSYSAGVNSYIEQNKGHLQFEFGALGYTPEKWTPYSSVLIAKLMTVEMSFSLWSDYAISEIAMRLGVKKARDFIPNQSNDINENDFDTTGVQLPPLDSTLISSLMGIIGSGYTGSNAWAISYKDGKSNHSILANDPHLPINLPPKWYQMHISCNTMNVIGYSIPGSPLILVGRNDSISWGVTNSMADILDIFLVKKGKNDDYYIDENGDEVKYEFIRDTIKIKNKETYQYYRKRTKMSALLSETHLWNKKKQKNKFFEHYDISFDWTNRKASDEFLCLYNLNKAQNYKSFKSALNGWNAPVLVFNYADESGKVALLPVGNIPLRNKTSPSIINPYKDKDYRWKGLEPIQKYGEKVIERDGFIYTANNDFYDDGIFISNNWEPNSRAIRIKQLLSQRNYSSIRDFEIMQMDQYSPYAKQFLNLTLPIINVVKERLNKNELKALRKLANWNFILSKDLNEPLIYTYFKRALVEETIKDELGATIYGHYTFLTNYPDRLILELLGKDESELFDNVKTSIIENKELIVIRAFRRTIKELTNEFGIDGISNLTYGNVHTLPLEHLLGGNEFLGRAVNLKTVHLGGDNTTLFNSESRYSKPNEVFVSSSMRFITDMQDSIIFMIMPGGESGDPMSPNYGDQVQLWLNGGYLKLSVSKKPNSDFELKTKFVPH